MSRYRDGSFRGMAIKGRSTSSRTKLCAQTGSDGTRATRLAHGIHIQRRAKNDKSMENSSRHLTERGPSLSSSRPRCSVISTARQKQDCTQSRSPSTPLRWEPSPPGAGRSASLCCPRPPPAAGAAPAPAPPLPAEDAQPLGASRLSRQRATGGGRSEATGQPRSLPSGPLTEPVPGETGARRLAATPAPPRPLLPHAPPYPARRERRGGAKGSWLTAARDWQLFSLARQSVGWTKGPISGASGRVGGNISWGSGMARQRSATSDWVHCQDEHALSPIGKASNLRDAPPQCGGWRCPERAGLGRLWGVGGCVVVRWGRGSGADPAGCRPPPGVLWERGGEVLGLWVRWLLSRRTPQAVEKPRGTLYISATGTCMKYSSRACSQLVELT